METRRTHLGSLGSGVEIAAIKAAPGHGFALLEHRVGLDVLQQAQVPILVLFLGDGDCLERGGDIGKSFLTRRLREPRVERLPLVVFAACGRSQVLGGRSDDAGRKGRRDLDVPALQKLEETLGVFFLLIRGLLEDRLNLGEPVLLRLRGEVGVAVPRLRLPGERAKQVLLRLCSLQLRSLPPSMVRFLVFSAGS